LFRAGSRRVGLRSVPALGYNRPTDWGTARQSNPRHASARNDFPMNTTADPDPLVSTADPDFQAPADYDTLVRFIGEATCRRLGLYRIPDELTLTVVIPVYNEMKTIHEIVRLVRAVPIRKQIILVDDCSKDGTRELLNQWVETQPDLTIRFHDKNQGKGAALRTGFEHATGQIVIVQDADLEYDPSEYPRLIQPLIEGKADVVYGSRFIGESHRVLNFWHSLANTFLTLLSNAFTNLNLTDMEVCYKVFRREVIQGITLKSNRFGFEPEVTAKISRFTMPAIEGRPARRCRIFEMPVSYNGRDYKEGKKIGWKDGVQALYCIIRYAFAD